MGNKNSGRRKKRDSETKTFADFAPMAARTIMTMSEDETVPVNVRLDAAKYVCNRHWGMPSQSHDIGIQAEQMESATELLRKLSVNRERGDNGSNREGEEGIPERVYEKEEV